MQPQATRSILLSVIISWLIVTAANLFSSKTGITIPPDFTNYITATLVGVLAAFIPDSAEDVLNQINDDIRKRVQNGE